MRGYDAKFLDELKSKNDLADVVSHYVRLEQRGQSFWGCCPFHHEKTPSFCVNTVDQFYYCFGCHKGGDVINFVKEIESVEFPDAVKILADRAGMEIPTVEIEDEKIKAQKAKKEAVLAILKESARYYAYNYRSGNCPEHEAYAKKRGLTKDILDKFGIGASSGYDGLPEYLKNKGFGYDDMVDSGVVSRSAKNPNRYFDALAGRLIIPVIDQLGTVIAFCGRIIGNQKNVGKYVNTRETIVFSKGKTLFNLNNLKKEKNEHGLDSVIIVEGHMDVVSMVAAGFNNVVASMGTALTKDQARIIKRFANNVYISYDGDFAGQKASIRGLEILKEEGLDVKVVSLPDGMDPDDVCKKLGAAAYKKLLDEALPLIDFKISILKRTFDIKTADGKRKFIKEAVKVVASSDSPSEREDLLKEIKDITGITYESLKRELEEFMTGKPQEAAPEIVTITGKKATQAENFILYSFIFSKPYTENVNLDKLEFSSPEAKEIKDYVVKELNSGEKIKPNLLFDALDDGLHSALNDILKIDCAEVNGLDEAKFFNDCVNSIEKENLNEKIEKLTKIYASETDISRRREIAKELKALMSEKTKNR